MNVLTTTTNIWYDMALIGIGILATLIGGVSLKLLETKFNKIGKLVIYYRIIGIHRQLKSLITIRVQIKNPSRDVKFLRDICLYEVYNDTKIRAIPSEKITNSKNGEITDIKILANNGSYSISSDPRSLVEYEFKFIFNENVNPNNDFMLEFVDDNEKKQAIKLKLEINTEWIVADIKKV